MQISKPLVAIVDDEEAVGRSIKRLSRSMGAECEAFLSGEEFLQVLESVPSYRPACLALGGRTCIFAQTD